MLGDWIRIFSTIFAKTQILWKIRVPFTCVMLLWRLEVGEQVTVFRRKALSRSPWILLYHQSKHLEPFFKVVAILHQRVFKWWDTEGGDINYMSVDIFKGKKSLNVMTPNQVTVYIHYLPPSRRDFHTNFRWKCGFINNILAWVFTQSILFLVQKDNNKSTDQYLKSQSIRIFSQVSVAFWLDI